MSEMLKKVEGVMLGRACMDDPYILASVDNRIYNDGSIIVVDGIYDGRQYKPDRINHLIKWIRSKQ